MPEQIRLERFPITAKFLARLAHPRPAARRGRPSTRQRIAAYLRQTVVPPTAKEIALSLGANLTTVQHILARLFASGELARTVLHTGHRGRPPYAWSFSPVPSTLPADEAGFQLQATGTG